MGSLHDWRTSEGLRLTADEKGRIEQRIERLRQKLLDLSTKNRMLNFQHPKASCLRVVDELPHQLFDVLREGTTLTFEPLADPTLGELEAYNAPRPDQVRRATETRSTVRPDAATWARHSGINVNYDLPVETDEFERADRHADRKVQTLHFPDELDARLRKIRSAGRTAIEESGANMLYLAFGFLEWRDQQTSKAHQAPLVLLPVELEREPIRGGQFRTKIRWTGEELQPNLSLKKKLEELNINLPTLEEDQPLENYLTEVTRAIRHKVDWTVRRYVTLGLFEFGKILLYLDLDPERWPSHAPLSDNPLVREILNGSDSADGTSEEGAVWNPDPDESPEAFRHRDLALEVVDRADSSQCEALEVALSGRNLVIQGPPGTGKSQTITNLVAAALARGKTVLFVAEKLAALEVVRRRMRELGLGDFCLELHSHKTRKTEALDDISTRIIAGSHMRPPKDYEGALSRLATRRERLATYIDIVSQPAAGFAGLSISDALMKAGQARRKLGSRVKAVEALRPHFETPDTIDWATFSDAKGRLRQFSEAISELGLEGSAFSHVWSGVSSARVLPHDSDQVAELAVAWANSVDAVGAVLDDPRLKRLTLRDIAAASEGLAVLGKVRADLLVADDTVQAVKQSIGLDLERSASGAADIAAVLEAARLAPVADLDLRNPELLSEGAGPRLRAHQERLDALKRESKELSEVFRESAHSTHVDDLEDWAAALAQKGFFVKFGKRWRLAVHGAAAILRPANLAAQPGAKATWLKRLRIFQLDLKALQADNQVEAMVGADFSQFRFSTVAHARVGDWADAVRARLRPQLTQSLFRASVGSIESLATLCEAARLASLDRVAELNRGGVAGPSFWQFGVNLIIAPAMAAIARTANADAAWTDLLQVVGACSAAARDALDAEQTFVSATDLDADYWFGAGGRPDLQGIGEQARLAAAHPEMLPAWLDFHRAFKASSKELEAALAVGGADGAITPSDMPLALDFLVFDAIARAAFASNPTLLSTSGKSLDVLRGEYAVIDAEVMELRRAHIAASLLTKTPPAGRNSGLKSELTEMALINAERAKQKRHVPIRQLVRRAGKAIQALKPCFMMGPLSVAQYIAPGTLKFDLVIMDEASQMRPEDAIGALARGGQAVIVGDTKQLPPTSFFDRIAESGEDDDEEMTLAEDAKSILELSEAIFTPRMLRWHYRSRHESLIAFSNKQFY